MKARSCRAVLVERHRVELEPVIDDPVAEPLRDLGLQRLDLLGAELDDAAGREIDQVVVVLARRALVAGPAVLSSRRSMMPSVSRSLTVR